MISRTYRFKGHNSLTYLHQKGVMVRAGGMSVRFVENKRRDVYRAAVIVSKKVHKSAVVRNRIRRRVYEYIRCYIAPTNSYDFAVLVYDEAVANMPAAQLENTLDAMFRRSKLTLVHKVESS